MKELRCSQCQGLYPEDELLPREDSGALVCPECSGLLACEDDVGCLHDEEG